MPPPKATKRGSPFPPPPLSRSSPPQFYEDGITCNGDKTPNCKADATSHRFVDTFENVYTAPSLQVPFWFNAGNHVRAVTLMRPSLPCPPPFNASPPPV